MCRIKILFALNIIIIQILIQAISFVFADNCKIFKRALIVIVNPLETNFWNRFKIIPITRNYMTISGYYLINFFYGQAAHSSIQLRYFSIQSDKASIIIIPKTIFPQILNLISKTL